MASPDQDHKIKVLFVCTANICRSPLAEAVLSQLAAESGLSDQLVIDSAAASVWQLGSPTHPRAIEVLRTHGIEFNHTARLFRPEDRTNFDYILGMDNDVLRSLYSIGKGPAKIQPFVKYAPSLKLEQIPDPMKSGDFAATYAQISTGCQGFLAFLRKTHEL